MPNNPETPLPHSLTLTERETLTVTGVKKIRYYDDAGAQLETDKGLLTLSGQGLQMGELSTRSGRLELSGRVDVLEYSVKGARGGWFRSKKP